MAKVAILVYLVICLSLLGSTAALAADTVDMERLRACSAEPDINQRLACFENISPEKNTSVRSIISNNMETSYITARSGLRMGADKTSGSILYEAQIFKNIPWLDGKVNHQNNWHYWLDLPIRLGVRQLTIASLPVRTPSFNPGLRFYFYEDGGDNYSSLNFPVNYYSFGLHHYSNGQDGASTLPDGKINTESGSFSTNYVEIAFHRAWKEGYWARLAFRQHFYGTFETFQHDQYERRHLSMEFQTPPSDTINFIWPFQYQVKATETYRHGYKYVVKNDVIPAMNVEAKSSDRFNTTIEVFAKPTASSWKDKDMSLYLRYDYGYDYYNINFQHRMNRIQFGLNSRSF